MERTWQVDASTRLEFKLVAAKKWSVRVNGTEVRTRDTLKWTSATAAFDLPDGRAGSIVTQPSVSGKPWIDLRIADRTFLDAGKKPFVCPKCKVAIAPGDESCRACGAAQPSVEDRLQERRRRTLPRGLAGSARFMFLLGLVKFVYSRLKASGATASLRDAQRAALPADSGVVLPGDALQADVEGLLFYGVLALVMLAVALLARRAPLSATLVMGMIWLGFFMAMYLNGVGLNPFVLAVQAVVAYQLWRCAKLAREIRVGEVPPC